jgi:hypothetical protein
MDDAWQQARRVFEAKMKRTKQEFGPAPAGS